MDLELHQMDVNRTFLNENLEEDIYMMQPKGFVHQGKENYVSQVDFYFRASFFKKSTLGSVHENSYEIITMPFKSSYAVSPFPHIIYFHLNLFWLLATLSYIINFNKHVVIVIHIY